MIWISHDLGVIAENTERLVVMYAGRVMESGDTDKILADPQHPYTQGLLASLPSVDQRRERLPVLQRDPAWLTDAVGA